MTEHSVIRLDRGPNAHAPGSSAADRRDHSGRQGGREPGPSHADARRARGQPLGRSTSTVSGAACGRCSP